MSVNRVALMVAVVLMVAAPVVLTATAARHRLVIPFSVVSCIDD